MMMTDHDVTKLLQAFIDDAMCCRSGAAPGSGLSDGSTHLVSHSTNDLRIW